MSARQLNCNQLQTHSEISQKDILYTYILHIFIFFILLRCQRKNSRRHLLKMSSRRIFFKFQKKKKLFTLIYLFLALLYLVKTLSKRQVSDVVAQKKVTS